MRRKQAPGEGQNPAVGVDAAQPEPGVGPVDQTLGTDRRRHHDDARCRLKRPVAAAVPIQAAEPLQQHIHRA